MAQSMRFGRRLALSSTRQIRHELMLLLVEEGTVLARRDAAVVDAKQPLPASAVNP